MATISVEGKPTEVGAGIVSRENVENVLTELPEESESSNVFLGGEAIIGAGAESGANVAVGEKTMKAAEMEGTNNVAIGYGVMEAHKTPAGNVAVGFKAMASAEASQSVAIGLSALPSVTGAGNTVVGYEAGESIITGKYNVAVGRLADMDAAVAETVAIGHKAHGGGDNDIVVGREARTAEKGGGNVVIGTTAEAAGTEPAENVIIGYGAGIGKKGSLNIFIGAAAGAGAASTSQKLIVANNNKKAIINGVMSETESLQEIGFLGAAPAKRPKVKGKRTTEFAEVLKTLCKGLGELGLITDETEAG